MPVNTWRCTAVVMVVVVEAWILVFRPPVHGSRGLVETSTTRDTETSTRWRRVATHFGAQRKLFGTAKCGCRQISPDCVRIQRAHIPALGQSCRARYL